MTPSKSYRRGYPVAILIGLNGERAAVWKIFSQVIKLEKNLLIMGSRNDPKALYNFHESIIDSIRPTIKEGLKSIIVVSPIKTRFSSEFLKHLKEHHAWLAQGPNKATFAEMNGTATTISEVRTLTQTPHLRKMIEDTTEEENENLLELLERKLNANSSEPLVTYSIEEIEPVIFGYQKNENLKPEYLLISETHLSRPGKGRLQRIIQIAANKQIKTRIISADSPAGKRILQLGGIVLISKID